MDYLSDLPAVLRDNMDATANAESDILARLQRVEDKVNTAISKLDEILQIGPIITGAMAQIESSPLFTMLSKLPSKRKSA